MRHVNDFDDIEHGDHRDGTGTRSNQSNYSKRPSNVDVGDSDHESDSDSNTGTSRVGLKKDD